MQHNGFVIGDTITMLQVAPYSYKRQINTFLSYKRNNRRDIHTYCWDHASSPKVLQEETASAEAVRM
jgi:hypothetical protein